jgi:hypothetical protein
MGPRARVVLECVAEHRRDPSPCNGLREDFERDTTHIREQVLFFFLSAHESSRRVRDKYRFVLCVGGGCGTQAKLDEGWQKRMVELCEGPFTRLHKCHALMAAQVPLSLRLSQHPCGVCRVVSCRGVIESQLCFNRIIYRAGSSAWRRYARDPWTRCRRAFSAWRALPA